MEVSANTLSKLSRNEAKGKMIAVMIIIIIFVKFNHFSLTKRRINIVY